VVTPLIEPPHTEKKYRISYTDAITPHRGLITIFQLPTWREGLLSSRCQATNTVKRPGEIDYIKGLVRVTSALHGDSMPARVSCTVPQLPVNQNSYYSQRYAMLGCCYGTLYNLTVSSGDGLGCASARSLPLLALAGPNGLGIPWHSIIDHSGDTMVCGLNSDHD